MDVARKMVAILGDRDPYGWMDSFDGEDDAVEKMAAWIQADPLEVIDQLLDIINMDN